MKDFAKKMRYNNSTEAENLLWDVLKGKQLEGYKFRRQHVIGGYIAGRVSGYPSKQDGGVHGFLSWSLYALVSFLLLVGAVNTTISGITGAVGSIFGDNNDKEVMVNLKNAQKESQKEAGSTLQNIQQDIYKIVNKAEKLNIVPQDATEEMREAQFNLDQKAAGALEEMELEEAVSEFVKELEFNIDNEGNLNIDTGDGELLDKKGLKDYLTNNTELSDSEIDGMINKWEAKIEKGIDKAEKLYADAKEKAVEIADKTADIAGKVAWGAFIILFLGAIVSILGGSLGSPSHLVREDNDETTRERRG
jgi:hypothetical protein